MPFARLLAVPLALLASACAPAAVDYSSLRSAAEARQRAAGSAMAPHSATVQGLLSRPLTAETAAQVALLNNTGVRAAVEELGIAEADLARVRRLPNPSIEASMQFGHDEPKVEVGAMLDLTELALLAVRSGAAGAAVEAAKLSSVGAVLELSFETRRAFYGYQAAAEVVELRRTVVRAFDASADLATRLRQAGNITELEAATQRAFFEESRLELQQAEQNAASARERLNALMGLWGRGVGWQAAPRLPERPVQGPATDQLESLAIERSLDLASAKQRFGAAARRANAAQAQGILPELKAGVVAEREDAEWALGPAVELELPLFYQGQGEIGVAKAQMRQQQNLYTDTAVRVRAAARNAATRLDTASQAVQYYRAVLMPLKQTVLDESQLQYNAMLIGAFQLLQAKRDQIETAAAYIQHLREYWLARVDVEQLLAGRITSDISSGGAPGASRAFARTQDAH